MPHPPVSSDRERVVRFLSLLAADPGRGAAAAHVAPETLAFALCRLWIDEIYVPGLSYVDGVKGDRSEAEAARFLDAFTPAEREALERFHRFLELRLAMLPEADRRRQAFPRTDAWLQLVRDACYLLDQLQENR